MPTQQKPIIHGADHLPGHADPIPGLSISRTFAETVDFLAITNDLRGYWRLGETSSPFADTSGNAGGPAPAILHASTTAMTLNITGALLSAEDDGAVQFNALAASDYLRTDTVLTRFDLTYEPMTVAAWVKPTADASTLASTVIGSYLNDGTYGPSGYRLGINYPALTPFFQRRRATGAHEECIVTGAPLAADTWYFLVGTFDPAVGHSLYISGELVDFDSTIVADTPVFGQGFWFGYGQNSVTPSHFKGGLDEVSVWGSALGAEDVLMLAGAGGTTSGGPPSGPAGGVLDGTYPNPGLVSTAVSAGTYGDATHVGRFTVDADGRLIAASNVAIASSAFDPATATTWWFPLADSDGTLVLDSNGALIPTLIPL